MYTVIDTMYTDVTINSLQLIFLAYTALINMAKLICAKSPGLFTVQLHTLNNQQLSNTLFTSYSPFQSPFFIQRQSYTSATFEQLGDLVFSCRPWKVFHKQRALVTIIEVCRKHRDITTTVIGISQ